jgi:tetratricopeptide (TPR) repeat protein
VELGDKQRAINDLTQCIRLNPNNADGYDSRGINRYQLGDKQGAIGDLQKAANLYLEQGEMTKYQETIDLIRKIQ